MALFGLRFDDCLKFDGCLRQMSRELEKGREVDHCVTAYQFQNKSLLIKLPNCRDSVVT